MKLRVEELEARDQPALIFNLATIAPSPQGDPGRTVLFITDDNPHSHHHREWTPPSSFKWHGIPVQYVVVDL